MDHLAAVLYCYSRECQADRIEPLASAGGMSGAQFWRVHTSRGPLCLRRWPKGHPSTERLSFIHSVLRHAENRGIQFLPVPIRATSGLTFVQYGDHLWELSAWLPGTANYEQSPTDAKLKAAMTALARMHIATSDFPLSPSRSVRTGAIKNRYARLQELARSGARELSQAIDVGSWPELAPLAQNFLAAFSKALPRTTALLKPLQAVSLPFQPCIRDVWHDHILYTGDVVTGIVDFGAVDIDTPACDVARLLGSLVGDDSVGWQTGLTAYSAQRSLTSDEIAAVGGLDASGTLLAGCNWIRWIYLEGREFENREQVVERFRRILARTLNLAARN